MNYLQRPASLATRQFLARLHAYLEGARRSGLVATVGARIGRALASIVTWVACLPITIVLHVAGFRRLPIVTERIGHLAAEVDCFLKARTLGELPNRRWFILAPLSRVANPHLLGYWRRTVPVVSNPALCAVLGAMSRWLFMRYDVGHYVLRLGATQDIYRLNAKWAKRPPILRLIPEDEAKGAEALRALGIPDGAWFVCVHAREAGFSPRDEAAHAHRNADPRAVIPAMQEVVRRGGWCIRMGDPTMSPLLELEGVIDYAHHPLRSARLDVILCARARFFLGTNSGLAFVSTAFGVPSALANMVPMSAMGPLASDISIPKLMYHVSEARLLRFDEVLDSPIGDFRYAKLYMDAGVKVIENHPNEILDLVREMLDRLDGTYEEGREDNELQERFVRLLKPGHYGYGAASRIGAAFLRKYRHLLVC